MKALNPVMPQGIPIVGSYGPNAARRDATPGMPDGFGPTPGNTPDEVPDEVEVQEVTDDGRPDAPSEEVPVSGE